MNILMMKIPNIICSLSIFLIAGQQFVFNSVQASNLQPKYPGLRLNQSPDQNSKFELYANAIKNCPREFTNWNLVESFTTKSYSLALCQQRDDLYLVGHQKEPHESFISALVESQNNNLLIAGDKDGFSYEISNSELKVFQDNQLIATENLLDLNLIGNIWQLQEIRYNNDELIEVANPDNYTIEFLPDGQLAIKADCNRALGAYTQDGSSISIEIGATTRALCPPESISEQYLRDLQAATIFFFKDGYLYFDLKFDTGTMKFRPE
ncbi:META domain-containing protein [Xenococcus sp. PCC 7305]|uniref:META domain-containing protein n=1 Tax=Xenococcus sp. PCC 7305 TaxID=102125 RepID=UPI0002E69B04|nr:META domain-containing protein [Xenococcus sp. PCC 7305]